MLLRTPPERRRRPPTTSPHADDSPGPSPPRWDNQPFNSPLSSAFTSVERPSPTKRPRFPIEYPEDNNPLSRRALQVYHDAWRFGSQQLVAHQRAELDSNVDFPGYAGEYGLPLLNPGSAAGDGDEDQDPLEHDSLRCTYKCRNMVKSEVLEALEIREKQVIELQATIKSLQVGWASAEAEKKRLMQGKEWLEQAAVAASGREASLHAQRLQDSEKADEMLRLQLKRCSELQARLQEEIQQKTEARITARAAEAKAEAAEEAREKKERDAAREIEQLKVELARSQRDSGYTLSRIKAENAALMGRARTAAEEVESLQLQLEEEQRHLAKSLEGKQELEHKVAHGMAQVSSRATGLVEADSVIRHLQEELSHCAADVAEARKLKQVHVNAALLNERLISEKARADRAEASLTELADLQLKLKQLEAESQAWRDMICGLPGVETCEDLPCRFVELQRESMAAMAKMGEVNAQVAELQTALERAESVREQAEAHAVAVQAEAADIILNLKRIERKVALISKERDGLKATLASYDEEEAVIASHRKPGDTVVSLAMPEKAKDKRIKELQVALTEAQYNAIHLEEAIARSSNASTEQRREAENLSEELNQAHESVKSLQRESERLRQEVAVLESKLGHGEYDRSTTKVLHLINNPEAEAHREDRQEALQAEVEALREKLDTLERGRNSLGDGSARDLGSAKGSGNIQAMEVTELTQRVTSLEKREARYRQVFADKISIFREACYLLFGYKVHMNEERDSSTGIPVTVLTLQSIFAQTDDEKLLFQLNSGHMDMLANEYTTSPEIERQVTTFLKNFKSIPAFIANLTMELFNKATMG